MPFRDNDDLGLLNAPLTIGRKEPEAPGRHRSVMEILGSAWRLENEMGSFGSREAGVPAFFQKPVEGFDPFEHIPEDKKFYAQRYWNANTAEEVEAVTRQIDREEDDRRALEQNGVLGTAAMMGAGVLSPLNLIPVGGTAWRTYRTGNMLTRTAILRGAMLTAAEGAGVLSAQEALLQSSQSTRTFEESAYNVAGGTFLMGVLGGGAGLWARRVQAFHNRTLDELGAQVEQELQVPASQWGVKLQGKSAEASARTFQQLLDTEDLFGESVQMTRELEDQLLQVTGETDVVQAQRALGQSINELRQEINGLQSFIENATPAERVDLSNEMALYAQDLGLKEGLLRDILEFRGLSGEIADELVPGSRSALQTEGLVDESIDLLEPGSIEISEEALLRDTADTFTEASATVATIGEKVQDEGIISRLPIVAQQDPLIRSMLSRSIETRRAIQKMAETPLKYAKNALGVATTLPAEAIIKQSRAPLAFALKHLDDQFVQYRMGRAAKFGDKARLDLGDIVGHTPNEKLTFQQFRQEVAKAMRNGDQHAVPEVASAARRFRQDVFDPLKQKAINLGALPEDVDVTSAPSYLMRVWDIDNIIARRDEFFQLNLDWLRQKELQRAPELRRTDAELQDITDRLIDRIIGTPDGRLNYNLLVDEDMTRPASGGGQGKARPLNARVYDIPDQLVEDFLENDIEVVAKTYERTMAPDLALMEVFGKNDLDEALDELKSTIATDWDRKLRQAASPAERQRMEQLKQQDLIDIQAVWERLRGTYAMPRDPNGFAVRSGRVVRTLNFLSLMGGVALSSVPDLARPMMVHGLKRYLMDGLVPLVSNFKAFRASAEEVKLAGTALDMLLDGRMMNIAELMDDYGRGSEFERVLNGMGNNFGKIAGISQWNSFMKQFAGMMTQSRILRATLDVKAGTAGAKEIRNLASGFIDAPMARRIADQFEAFGDKQGSVMLPNTMEWTDRQAARVFRAALARDVDRIIVTPGQDKPLWLSNEWGKLLGQFKSFFISATQRVLLSGLQDRDLGVLNGMVFATGLGMLVTLMYDKLKEGQPGYRPISRKPEDLILEGIDRSGVTGWFFEANAMAEKLTRGRFGLSALTGKEPMSRYASRNVIDSLVGPSAGRVEDVARVSGAAATGEWRQSDTRALRRLFPYQNLFYLRQLFDHGERSLSESLGIAPE